MEGSSPLQGPPLPAPPPIGSPIPANKPCSRSGPLFTPHHDVPSFEFRPRWSPPSEFRERQWGGSFADELFQDGRILPLKLPPRLQHACHSRPPSRRSSLPGSPTSPGSSPRRGLLWIRPGGTKGRDFDPFMAALERVREAEWVGAGREHGGFPTRGARSLSPMRVNWGVERRRGPSPQVDHPWLARQGPVGFPTWAAATTHVQETSSEDSSGSENKLGEGEGEGGGGGGDENSKFFGSATSGCGERGAVAKGLGKKRSFAASWRGMFFCMGVPCVS